MPPILTALLLATAQPPSLPAPDPCTVDRERMLALSQQAFDQDLEGGWRAVAARPGCGLAAADLIHDYRETHAPDDTILYWHEGQLRAEAGQTEAAILLFERSHKDPSDAFGWNSYVDATIAFLRGDLAALVGAREALAGIARPADFNPHDPQGRPLQLSWPLNLNIVDGLIACFGRSYAEAYARTCVPSSGAPRD